MSLVDIVDLAYVHSLVFYIKHFKAIAVISDEVGIEKRVPFEFKIEYRPIGDCVIHIQPQEIFSAKFVGMLEEKLHLMEKNGNFNFV